MNEEERGHAVECGGECGDEERFLPGGLKKTWLLLLQNGVPAPVAGRGCQEAVQPPRQCHLLVLHLQRLIYCSCTPIYKIMALLMVQYCLSIQAWQSSRGLLSCKRRKTCRQCRVSLGFCFVWPVTPFLSIHTASHLNQSGSNLC